MARRGARRRLRGRTRSAGRQRSSRGSHPMPDNDIRSWSIRNAQIRHASSGFSPKRRWRNQSAAAPATSNTQNAVLSPCSARFSQSGPVDTQRRAQTSAHGVTCARSAIASTVPNAPVDAAASRTQACCVREIGSTQSRHRIGASTERKIVRTSRGGWMMTHIASASVAL
jgi:hypothetical protein